MEFEMLRGRTGQKYIVDLAELRIKYFREYPYLYDGNMEYENKYLEGFINHEQALIVVAKKADRIVGMSTAIPFNSDYEIIDSSIEGFSQIGLKAREMFYFGEIIVLPNYRGQRIATTIFKTQEDYARALGYKGSCFLVVVREQGHPLKPEGYVEPDVIWRKLGYIKTDIYTYFVWPTVDLTGNIFSTNNKMVYWVKQL